MKLKYLVIACLLGISTSIIANEPGILMKVQFKSLSSQAMPLVAGGTIALRIKNNSGEIATIKSRVNNDHTFLLKDYTPGKVVASTACMKTMELNKYVSCFSTSNVSVKHLNKILFLNCHVVTECNMND